MSADNYVAVICTKDGKYGVIPYGNMSCLDEDCMYTGVVGGYYDSRADALVAALDEVKEQPIVEYGVIELKEPIAPCGACYYCTNGRRIVGN